MHYFLCIDITRSKRGISVFERKYILHILIETDILGNKPSNTPIEAGKKIDNKKPIKNDRNQILVGKLINLSHIRPNIAFVINMMNQYMHSPKKFIKKLYTKFSDISKALQEKGCPSRKLKVEK